MSFGQQQQQQQPIQRLSWQDYLDRIKNGPAPTYTPSTNPTQPQGSGTAAGWVNGPAPNGIQAMKGATQPYTSVLPSLPVDYGRMHSILNSGVLTGGKAQTAADIPPVQLAPPPAPAAPAQPQQQSPLQAFMTSLLSGGK